MRAISTIAMAAAAALVAGVLAGCGGGGSATAASAAVGAGGGSVTGDIAKIAGSYNVKVVAQDCDPADSNATTTIETQPGNACKITTKGVVTSVEIRRDVMTPGNYTLTIGSDGSVKIGSITFNCAASAICRVDGTPANMVYTMALGAASAGSGTVVTSTLAINTTASPKTVVGIMYGNSTSVSGATVASGESGVVAIE